MLIQNSSTANTLASQVRAQFSKFASVVDFTTKTNFRYEIVFTVTKGDVDSTLNDVFDNTLPTFRCVEIADRGNKTYFIRIRKVEDK